MINIYFAALLNLPIIPLDALRIFVIQPKPVLLLLWRKNCLNAYLDISQETKILICYFWMVLELK